MKLEELACVFMWIITASVFLWIFIVIAIGVIEHVKIQGKWEIQYYPLDNRYYPKYSGEYIEKYHVYKLSSYAEGSLYANSEEGAKEIIQKVRASWGEGSKTIKV